MELAQITAMSVFIALGSPFFEPTNGLNQGNGYPSSSGGLTISASLDKPSYMPGEEMLLTCKLSNGTSSDIAIENPQSGVAAVYYSYVMNSNGEKLPRPQAIHIGGEYGSGTEKPWERSLIIPANQEVVFATVDLSVVYAPKSGVDHPEDWPSIYEPGTYSVQCLYRPLFGIEVTGFWQGKLATIPITVTIEEPLSGASLGGVSGSPDNSAEAVRE